MKDETIETIESKLFQVQARVGKISKDSTNPFYKSKYFDINKLIEHIQPLLFEYSLLLTQPIIDGNVSSVITDVKTGAFIKASLALPNIDDPQAIGKVITYYRRYTLTSLLALQAEDDDGNSGTKAVQKGGLWNNKTDDNRKWLNEGTSDWDNAEQKIRAGKVTVDTLKKHYKLNKISLAYFQDLQEGV